MASCRFCSEYKRSDDLLKYGVRHYAHYRCYLAAGKPLSDLHDWQIASFPYTALRDHGLLDDPLVKAACAREQAGEAE